MRTHKRNKPAVCLGSSYSVCPQIPVANRRGAQGRVLISSVPSDAHTWNLVFLQLLIEEYGLEVHNLGACVPLAHLIDNCLALRPDLVVLSSVNGHGYTEGSRVIRVIRSTLGLKELCVVIGGKLTTRGMLSEQQDRSLLEDGFDAVFSDECSVEKFGHFLEQRFRTTICRSPLVSSGDSSG
jgi:methylmalonyl-CoA mutase cobalamin-binding subunit